MASRKRARAAASTAAAELTVFLSGGEPLSSALVELWRTETLCDVRVQAAGGAPFAAHRNVLAAGSSTFRALLTSEMRDKAAPSLPEVPADAFKHVLGFLYEGSCEPDRRLLPELLRAANYLGIEPLKQATATALQRLLSPENALDAWSLGEQQAAPELAAAAKDTALARFEELGDSLAAAPLDKVQALLADDRLTAASEEAAFTAVQRVVDARQPSPDEATVLGLMRHVRFACMRREFLDGTVRQWPRLQSHAGRELLLDALTPFVGVRPAPRPGFGPRALYVLAGLGSEIGSVEVYDVQNDAWSAGPARSEERCDGAAALLHGKVYLLGGQDSSSVEALDLQTGAWAAMPSMRTVRCDLAAAADHGLLYAIGGSDHESASCSSVDVFDPQTGTWTATTAMPTRRREMGAAVVDGKIYVVGGYNGRGQLDTVEVYDPRTRSWATLASMPTERDCLGVAALGGKVFAVGGGKAGCAFRTAEAYDPQTNTWEAVAPMCTSRCSFGLAAVQGRLFAVGGFADYGDEDMLDSVEAYDPQLDRWTMVAPMSAPRGAFALVAG